MNRDALAPTLFHAYWFPTLAGDAEGQVTVDGRVRLHGQRKAGMGVLQLLSRHQGRLSHSSPLIQTHLG